MRPTERQRELRVSRLPGFPRQRGTIGSTRAEGRARSWKTVWVAFSMRLAEALGSPVREMTEADEPDDDAPVDSFDASDVDGDDATAAPAQGWLGAIGQMAAALLIVVALVAAFIAVAAALRRLLP